ncbi:MAG: UMP kinase [Phycisphaerales bacterium]|nr:UMP kinase [Phycisphaerales bacterium]
MPELKYRRIILKVSGEGLCGVGETGLNPESLDRLAREIKSVVDLGAQIGLVIGGGNLIRGDDLAGKVSIAPAAAHYMGMLATVINAIAIQEILEPLGVDTRVQSAIAIDRVCEPFVRRRAIRHLEKGRVVLFAAGTGNPFVTTDTCAALRASEIGADALLKATKVDGVYTADPVKDRNATRLPFLTYNEVIDGRLRVMDLSAVVMCQENHVPLVVFDLWQSGHMSAIVRGEPLGTLVSETNDRLLKGERRKAKGEKGRVIQVQAPVGRNLDLED